ncbi:hypothetical protein ACLB2K_050403 [Fragaria x ananassa]
MYVGGGACHDRSTVYEVVAYGWRDKIYIVSTSFLTGLWAEKVVSYCRQQYPIRFRADAGRRKREPEYARNFESTKRACHEVVFHVEEKHIEMRKNDVDRDCGISIGCDPKAFKVVASRISNEKVVLIQELRFGPVRQFRCSEINMSLCKMLLDKFNVEKCTIKIHGRNLTVAEKDFDRLMRLRCRGTEVSLSKKVIHDPEVADLQDSGAKGDSDVEEVSASDEDSDSAESEEDDWGGPNDGDFWVLCDACVDNEVCKACGAKDGIPAGDEEHYNPL